MAYARIMSVGVVLCLLVIVGGMGAPCRATEPGATDATQAKRRQALVRHLATEISDRRVLAALAEVPRHLFVPASLRTKAYANRPLPIGQEQTISQPYIVAYMTQALRLQGKEKVLEVGTGSGYQAAILARTAKTVYSVEILPELSARADKILKKLKMDNVHLRIGDGFEGWAEQAPFDGVLVTAAPTSVPPPLIAQLKEGGRLVIPLGVGWRQQLKTYVKRNGKLVEIDSLAVRFVPMTGKAQR